MDPITPILAYKEAGLLVVACGLFIANYLQNREVKNQAEKMNNFVDENRKAHDAQTASQTALLKSLDDLVKIQQEQTTRHQHFMEQLSQNQTAIASNQEVLESNQMHITQGLQQMIDRLIGIVGRN